MIKTPIGIIEILVNHKSTYYRNIELIKKEKNFFVDARYKIIVDVPFNDVNAIIIECKLIDFTGDDVKGCIESGEKLALVSFYKNNIKLSIGVEDEISNVECSYIDYGLKVTVSQEANLHQISFGIAWIFMKDKEKEDIYTWFAADPTLWT